MKIALGAIPAVFPMRVPIEREAKRNMRDPIENITILQKQLNQLQLENQLLKNILDRSGISLLMCDKEVIEV